MLGHRRFKIQDFHTVVGALGSHVTNLDPYKTDRSQAASFKLAIEHSAFRAASLALPQSN